MGVNLAFYSFLSTTDADAWISILQSKWGFSYFWDYLIDQEEGRCGSTEAITKSHQIQIQHDSGGCYSTRGIGEPPGKTRENLFDRTGPEEMASRVDPPEKICARGHRRIIFSPSQDRVAIRHLPPKAAGDPEWFDFH